MNEITHTREFNWFAWLSDLGKINLILVVYLIILNGSEAQTYIQSHFIIVVLGFSSLVYLANEYIKILGREKPQYWIYIKVQGKQNNANPNVLHTQNMPSKCEGMAI